jgi:O-acetyl-ADP-ribose deacetylase (regulator of RNase III)
MQIKINQTLLELVEEDITELAPDAIVNAANSRLQMGGGVAGAIRRKGGESIQVECNKIGYCPVGSAVITCAGSLKPKWVIHVVGPRWGEGEEDKKLRNATLSALKLAQKYKIKSIAFPAISAGIFGFPIKRCANILLSTTIDWIKEKPLLEKVIFCLYDRKTFNTFLHELNSLGR